MKPSKKLLTIPYNPLGVSERVLAGKVIRHTKKLFYVKEIISVKTIELEGNKFSHGMMIVFKAANK